MEPTFEVFKGAEGGFRFRLRAPNGEIIAQSESYASRSNCMNGIESLKKNAPLAKVVEV